MTRHHVPRLDSPSRQLLNDLVRQLEQVEIFNSDLKKVHAYERRLFYDSLDQKDRELEAIHNAALDEAAASHDRVREEAEATMRQYLREEEEERLRKEEEARKEQEHIEREKAEKQRQEQLEAARLEAERKAEEDAKKKAGEEAERERRAAQEEKDRKERQQREETEAAQRQEAEKAKKAQEEAEQQARLEQQQKLGARRLTAEEVSVQERYVALHKTLKEMRQWLRGIGKEHQPVKQTMGDMRRTIKKCVGQLRDGKGTNKQQIQQIKVELEKAATVPEPSVDIRRFFAFPPEEIAHTQNNVPALLIYGLNIFAKCLISALITEASINPGHAEPIGIVAAQIFSMDGFMYKGIHMSDILWAKYRVVCPPLWGFTGSENTDDGRRALGWWREEANGPFISEQAHLDRMTALGAGFSAVTLRNFGKTARRNPFPNTLFWTSITKILSIPPSEIQDTQITLLQAMLRYSEERVLTFFGQFGLALLRKAIVELPTSLQRDTMPINHLKLLQEIYLRDKNILL